MLMLLVCCTPIVLFNIQYSGTQWNSNQVVAFRLYASYQMKSLIDNVINFMNDHTVAGNHCKNCCTLVAV